MVSNKMLELINNKIDAVKENIDSLNKLDPESIEYKVNSFSLNKVLTELLEEKNQIKESYGLERVMLRLKGKNVGHGQISARILYSSLEGFQHIADSIANALGNSPTHKGSIPKRIQDMVDMQVIATPAGSFCIEMEAKIEPSLSGTSLLTESLYKFMDLLYSSDDADLIQEHLGHLGIRTLVYYRQWLKNIEKHEINIDLNWRNTLSEMYTWDSTDVRINNIIEILDAVKQEETDNVIMEGKLTGINIRKETFEIALDDGNIISGKSKFKVLVIHSNLLDRRIRASLIKTTTINTNTNTKKVSWFLEDILDV